MVFRYFLLITLIIVTISFHDNYDDDRHYHRFIRIDTTEKRLFTTVGVHPTRCKVCEGDAPVMIITVPKRVLWLPSKEGRQCSTRMSCTITSTPTPHTHYDA